LKGKGVNSFSTNRYRFELTPSGLRISTVKGAATMDFDPGEALSLAAYLGGDRLRRTRREQRRIERQQGGPVHNLLWLEGFKTGTHQFEFLLGQLTIFDLQRDACLHFDPYHVVRLVDFIRIQRRGLMHMPRTPEVPVYFSSPNVPNFESETRHPG
jgi:hypothetical protein